MYFNENRVIIKRRGKSMSECTVMIKTNGHIYYQGELISILAQWNKYDDLFPDEIDYDIEAKAIGVEV